MGESQIPREAIGGRGKRLKQTVIKGFKAVQGKFARPRTETPSPKPITEHTGEAAKPIIAPPAPDIAAPPVITPEREAEILQEDRQELAEVRDEIQDLINPPTEAPVQPSSEGSVPTQVKEVVDKPLPSPQEVYEHSLAIIPEQKRQEGVYTEVHLQPDGTVYVTPSFIDDELHRASVVGTHSMWDAVRIYTSLQSSDTQEIQRLNLTDKTIIARGLLSEDPTTHAISLSLTRYQKTNPEVRKLVDAGNNEKRVVLEKVLSAGLPIKIVDGERNITISRVEAVPKVTTDYLETHSYTLPYPEGEEPQVYSGTMSYMHYSDSRGSESSSGVLQVRAHLQAEVYQANARTHQEAIAGIARDPTRPRNLGSDYAQWSDVNLGYHRGYSVAASHTLDVKNHDLHLAIQVRNRYPGEIDLEGLRDFEYTVYYSYMKEVLDKAVADGKIALGDVSKYNVVFSTAYQPSRESPNDFQEFMRSRSLALEKNLLSPTLYQTGSTPEVILPHRIGKELYGRLQQ